VAATGAGALALGSAGLPAFALESKPAQADLDMAPATSGTLVEPNATGQEALAQLDKAELNFVAKNAGMSASTLESLLEQGDAIVSPSGAVAFIDDFTFANGAGAADAAAAEVPGDPENGSRPGANHTIYIDFTGGVVEGTEWNASYEVDAWQISPYNVDDLTKHAIWASVAQNYAPFDINVTTSDPGYDAMVKTSASDNTYGARLLIVPEADEMPEITQSPGLLGIAWVGGFGSDYLNPVLVFADRADDSPQLIGMAGSHELGHNLGLHHHGINDSEYYAPGPGSLWGPIMGAAEHSPLTTWSTGDYAGATNPEQDDLAVITDRGAARHFLTAITDQSGNPWTGNLCPYLNGALDENFSWDSVTPEHEFHATVNDRCAFDQADHEGAALIALWAYVDRSDPASDPHGNTIGAATSLDNSSGEFAADGVIITSDDVDVFSFVTEGGPFAVEAAPITADATLDIKLSLLDADGNVIAEDEQETVVAFGGDGLQAAGLGASLVEDLEMGVYYLQVEGRGQGDPGSNTEAVACCYSDYGSLGYYTLAGEAEPFDAAPVTITSPEDGAVVEAADLDVTGTAEVEAEVTLSIDGDPVGSVTVDADGNWATTLEDELPVGESTITAQQTIGSITVPQTASVTVVVEGDEPGDENGSDSGTDDGSDSGSDSGGDDNGDGELPDTGTSSMLTLALGGLLLALGGIVYARTRRATV
jgi:LPXTG-motif cell wall-anchored protein